MIVGGWSGELTEPANVERSQITKWQKELLRRRGQRRLILRYVDALPVASLNAIANLRGGFAFVRLFVGVKIFAFANPADCGVFARVTIEQAAVALAAIAVAIAWLLIKDFLDAGGDAVSILGNWVGEERGAQGGR